jgi:hypothetical protein
MGNRITQKIYECSICGKTPENGEHMWHMGNETWCKKCCEEQEQQEQEEEVNESN